MSVQPLTEAEQLRLLDHLAEKHGLAARECLFCSGNGCQKCSGEGVLYRAPAPQCDDPRCWASARLAAIAAEERS